MKKTKGPLVLLNLDKAGQPTTPETPAEAPQRTADDSTPVPAATPEPSFKILGRRPGFAWDLARAALIVLALIVAAGFVLVVLPQSTVDRLAASLEARHGAAQQEQIALLYLGDDMNGNDFRIRGLVRNISSAPIEHLDAAVRFYAHDGTILETTVVRMNKETIEPNETAQLELIYPNYKMDFGSYSVDFKLRQGSSVEYKDMRPAK